MYAKLPVLQNIYIYIYILICAKPPILPKKKYISIC